MKRDVLRENSLQIHLIVKKNAIWQSGKIAYFAKAIKIIQKLTLNTHKRHTAKNTFDIKKNDIILKSGKNGHFVKAAVRENLHK